MNSVPPDFPPDHPDHDDSQGTLQAHDHSTELRGADKRSLALALVLITGYMFVEVIGGLLSGSLALIADAGHMLTDAASIGLALTAMHFATRSASTRRTFGYHRLEILAALVNALTLVAISIWVIVEAYQRFFDPPTVQGGLVLTVGSVGLLVNVAAAWILHGSAKHSVNVEGVADVHDVHCWTLAPGYEALTAHVTVDPGRAREIGHQTVLDRLRRIAYREFKLNHVTLQLEETADHCNEDHHVDTLRAASRS